MSNPFRIIWLKAAVAFLIPFFATIGGSLAPYALNGLPLHTKIAVIIIICSTMVASLSALGSFLSTTFAEHKAQQQSGLDDTQPPPITAAQVAAPCATRGLPSLPGWCSAPLTPLFLRPETPRCFSTWLPLSIRAGWVPFL